MAMADPRTAHSCVKLAWSRRVPHRPWRCAIAATVVAETRVLVQGSDSCSEADEG